MTQDPQNSDPTPIVEQRSSAYQPEVSPPQPSAYPNLWQLGGLRTRRALLVIVLAAVGYLVLMVLTNLLLSAWLAVRTLALEPDQMLVFQQSLEFTLVVFFGNSLPLFLCIPLSVLLSRLVGQGGESLSSVVDGVRWGWLAQCAAIGVVVVVGFLLLAGAMDTRAPLGMKSGSWMILLPFLILVPLQTAGIEYLLRGVVNRGAASLSASPTVGAVLGAVVSSVGFVLIHAVDFIRVGDVSGGVMWFLLGLLLAFLAWRTGGLEAGIVVGSVNTLLVYLPVLFTGMNWPEWRGGHDSASLLPLVPMVVAVGAIVLLARMRRVQRLSAVSDMAGGAS